MERLNERVWVINMDRGLGRENERAYGEGCAYFVIPIWVAKTMVGDPLFVVQKRNTRKPRAGGEGEIDRLLISQGVPSLCFNKGGRGREDETNIYSEHHRPCLFCLSILFSRLCSK